MTLYEMTEAENSLYNLLEAGEIDEQTFADTCEAIGAAEKLEAYGKIITQLKADTAAIAAEKKRLEEKAKRCGNAIERLKSAVLLYLRGTGREKAEGGLFSFRVSRSEETVVDNLELIPPDFIRVKYEADKTAIKKAIESGQEVCGAHIENKESVVMR